MNEERMFTWVGFCCVEFWMEEESQVEIKVTVTHTHAASKPKAIEYQINAGL
jgi:hypothetical protein